MNSLEQTLDALQEAHHALDAAYNALRISHTAQSNRAMRLDAARHAVGMLEAELLNVHVQETGGLLT